MSHGTKYRLSYTDNFSQAVVIDLKKDGYSGAITALTGAKPPLTITHDNSSDFFFEPILGTWVTIRIIVKTVFGYSDLFTTDPREWQVTVSIAGSNYFTGYLMPFYFNHDYKCAPYVLELIASDQLGILKDILYPEVIQDYSSATPIEMLFKILTQTGLQLNLKEGVNIYEDSMTTGADKSPLDQCYYPLTGYQDEDGNNLDCYTILKNILQNFTAVIRQVEGEWHIWRPSEAVATYTRRKWLYLSIGGGSYSYTSNESHDPTVATTASGVSRATLCRTLNYGTLSLMESWRDYKLLQDFKTRDSMLLNPDFIDWIDTSNPLNWSNHGCTLLQIQHACYIDGVTSSLFVDYIHQSIVDNFTAAGSSRFLVKVKFKSTCYGGDGIFMMRLEVIYGGIYYYCDFANSNWTTTVTDYELALPEGTDEFDLSLLSNVLNGWFPLGFSSARLLISAPHVITSGHIVVDYASLQLKYGTSNVCQDYPTGINETVTVNTDNLTSGETIELLSSDLPQNMPVPTLAVIENHKYIYNRGLYLDSDMHTPTDAWNDSGSTEDQTLIEILKGLIAKQYGACAEMISVNIMTKLLAGDDTVQLTEHSNKKYFPRRIEWDQKAGIMRYEMIEIICESGFLLLETGDYILLETGDKIII